MKTQRTMRSALQLALLAVVGCAGSPTVSSTAATTHPGEPPPVLRTGITGTIGEAVPDSLHPIRQLALPEVRSLVLELAEGAMPASAVHERLAGTGLRAANLVSSGVLRAESGHYLVDFGLFTASDVERLAEVGEQYGAMLARDLLQRRDTLEPLVRSMTAAGVREEDARYIVVGCFMLNWLAGPVARELGYLGATRTHGNSGTYALWAMDRPSQDLEGLFWGSHNDYGDDHVLTSFGDHHSLPRVALPDVLRRLRGAVRRLEVTPPVDAQLGALAAAGIDRIGKDAASIMLALRYEPLRIDALDHATELGADRVERILELLQELQYVEAVAPGTFTARVPVLAADDLDALREVRQVTAPIIEAWLARHHDDLRDELSETTPLQHDVPFAEIFTHVWHEVFGVANRVLVEEGWFGDPYDREHPGFIPAVWHPELTRAIRGK